MFRVKTKMSIECGEREYEMFRAFYILPKDETFQISSKFRVSKAVERNLSKKCLRMEIYENISRF